MRHPKILYRPMFTTKGSSSYGRGIASNFVGKQYLAKDTGSWVPKTYGMEKILGIIPKLAQPVVKYGTLPYAGGVATSGIGEKRGFSLDPRDWFGGEEKEKEKETFTLTDEETERLIKQKGALEKGPEEDLTETIKETEKIDLTPSEKEGLKVSMMVGGGKGALSAKGDVIDVLKSTLLGAATEGTKVLDPALEKKYRIWGEAQAKRDIKIAKEKAKLADTPSARLDAAIRAKLGKVESINYAYNTEIKKVSPKVKKNKVGEVRQKQMDNLRVGDVYFDEDDQTFKHVAGKNDKGVLQIEAISKDKAIKLGKF